MLSQTIVTGSKSTVNRETLLRRTLQADGIFEIICGLGLLAAAAPITALLGQPADLTWLAIVAGLDLIPLGFFFLWLASRPVLNLKWAFTIALLNDLTAVALVGILLMGLLPLQAGGVWLLALVAVDLFILAGLEFAGIWQLRRQA